MINTPVMRSLESILSNARRGLPQRRRAAARRFFQRIGNCSTRPSRAIGPPTPARPRRWLAALVGLWLAACAPVPPMGDELYTPAINQPGKDVVWWPTPQPLVEKMLDMAKVTHEDYVIDLGSGDGRTVIAAAKRGARTLGIEYDPDLVALSRRNIAAAGVGDRAAIVLEDIFRSDFSRATVITMFLLPQLNLRLRPALLSLRAGTRITSNTFDMGDWEADEIADLGCVQYCMAYLWIVPARAQGRWRVPEGELELKQEFQKIRGTFLDAKRVLPRLDGRVRGEEIVFAVGGAVYRGRVRDGAIDGTVTRGGVTRAWNARRID